MNPSSLTATAPSPGESAQMCASALLLDSRWEFLKQRAHTGDLIGHWFQEYQEAKHELLFYSPWWQEVQTEPRKLYYLELSWEL